MILAFPNNYLMKLETGSKTGNLNKKKNLNFDTIIKKRMKENNM
jgi:hypothetical protein